MSADPVSVLAELLLVDHHCHGVVLADLADTDAETMLTEGGTPPAGASAFDTPLGLSVRRHCAPLLDLPPHVAPADYLLRRRDLGGAEVARRLLAASGTGVFVVDTGFRADELAGPGELAALAGSGAAARTVVRLEAVADSLLRGGVDPGEFRPAFGAALSAEVGRTQAVGLKSIAAYRTGFAFEPTRPSVDELAAAVARSPGRAADPVLSRELLWAGAALGLPIQVHVGLGDRDVRLPACDPTLLTDLVALLPPVPLLLLHCWPYHRQAGYLAAIWPTVHLDLGLTTQHVGPTRAAAVLAEAMEVTPFGKLLYSSDAFGLAEHYLLGALGFRRALGAVLAERVASTEWSAADACRIAALIGRGNAERIYGLGDGSPGSGG